MLVRRNGYEPAVDPAAVVAESARIVGDVWIGAGCVVDHGAVLVADGAPVRIGQGTVVLPNAVVRAVGGTHRPAYPVELGEDCLVGPGSVLTGCTLGRAVYVATMVMVFHGAKLGDGVRLGAGSIVHLDAQLAAGERVGLRQIAVPGGEAGRTVVTADVDEARRLLARVDFFDRVFEHDDADPVELHTAVVRALRAEAAGWHEVVGDG